MSQKEMRGLSEALATGQNGMQYITGDKESPSDLRWVKDTHGEFTTWKANGVGVEYAMVAGSNGISIYISDKAQLARPTIKEALDWVNADHKQRYANELAIQSDL